MSRLTSAQIIGLGEYLEPDFDPTSLTVSQLLGVLGFHNIRYPTPYTKGKLAQLFNDEVKPRAAKFKKERLKKEQSIASEDGIMDGHTGEPLNKKEKAPVSRRSSRRLSTQIIQVDDDDTSPPRPEPPKRRRSSAQPLNGGRSRKVVPAVVPLLEESEPEEEIPKKVGRSKKTTSAVQSRRLSHLSGDESGWDDKNIFQSGAESSSPARPSPVRPRVSRSSVGPRKSRKSTSAPPQMPQSPSPVPLQSANAQHTPPLRFTTPVPEPAVFTPAKSRLSLVREFTPDDSRGEAVEQPDTIVEPSEPLLPDGQEGDSELESELEDELVEVSEAEDTVIVSASPTSDNYRPSTGQILARVLAWLLIIAAGYTTVNYSSESAAIGFCDRGSSTNQHLDSILGRRAAIQACIREGRPLLNASAQLNGSERTAGLEEPCPLPPLIPLPEPSNCTPCPSHATCTQHTVTCDPGYLLKPHILLSFIPVIPSQTALTTTHLPRLAELFFKGVAVSTDGIPGFGSVGLPPRCVEDPERKRHIGNLGKAIEAELAKERGRRVCVGVQINDTAVLGSPEEARKWGVEIGDLKRGFKHKVPPSLLHNFDDLFTEAIQQLTQWGGVFVGEAQDGTRYVAHTTPSMTWTCTLTVKSREVWAAWRSTVLASILGLFIALGLRVRVTRRQKETKRVAELVQVALDTLRNQEFQYYTDPVSVPKPSLSSIQLRDTILQEEHSIAARRRLWERVESVVEGNANVRTNLEESEGGDEARVWRWVGSTGTPGRKG